MSCMTRTFMYCSASVEQTVKDRERKQQTSSVNCSSSNMSEFKFLF